MNEKSIVPPKWIYFVKSGCHKERIPDDPYKFWYIRAASILRKCALSPIGVSRLRKIYGDKKRRGSAPERHTKAGGAIIRKIMQQLEAAGFLEKYKVGKRMMGRKTTSKGIKLLNSVAKEIKG
ncbi:MAG: 40S ribosomal protein S19 [Candidatus Micrarchaeia archaeon]